MSGPLGSFVKTTSLEVRSFQSSLIVLWLCYALHMRSIDQTEDDGYCLYYIRICKTIKASSCFICCHCCKYQKYIFNATYQNCKPFNYYYINSCRPCRLHLSVQVQKHQAPQSGMTYKSTHCSNVVLLLLSGCTQFLCRLQCRLV